MSSKRKIQRSYTSYRPHSPMLVSLDLMFVSKKTSFCYISFLSTELTCYLKYNSFETHSKPSWMEKVCIKPALMLCVWNSRSSKNLTLRLKILGQKSYWIAKKISIRCSITKTYFICRKSSILNLSRGIIMTFL